MGNWGEDIWIEMLEEKTTTTATTTTTTTKKEVPTTLVTTTFKSMATVGNKIEPDCDIREALVDQYSLKPEQYATYRWGKYQIQLSLYGTILQTWRNNGRPVSYIIGIFNKNMIRNMYDMDLVNKTTAILSYGQGRYCNSDIFERSTDVTLTCDMSQVFSRDFQQLKILSVKEPSTCFYEIEASIPCCFSEKITTTTQESESPVVFSTTKATTTKITIENENIVPE